MKIILETPRLALREMTLDDLDFLAGMLGDPYVMRYYPQRYSRQEAEAWIRRARDRYVRYGHGNWLAIDRASGQPVGQVGLVMQLVDGVELPEVGYIIHRPFQRCGLATEAALAVRDFALDTLGKPFVISLVRPVNVPSQGVARKLGMTPWKHALHAGFDHLVFRVPSEARHPKRIETPRLLLRPCEPDDRQALHALWTDAEVRRYLWDNRVLTHEQSGATLTDSLERFAEHGFGLWAICRREQPDLIGFCGYVLRGDVPELLYGLSPAFQGQGLATEATSAMLRHGFETLGFPLILAATDAPNVASLRLLHRLGMRRVQSPPRSSLLRFALDRETFSERDHPRRLVILDVDGTLTPHRETNSSPFVRTLRPGVVERCREVRAAGFAMALASNQGGLLRGMPVEAVEGHLTWLAGLLGISVWRYAWDPERKKPSPAMLRELTEQFGADPADTCMVGDNEVDRLAAQAAGVEFVDVEDFLAHGLPCMLRRRHERNHGEEPA